MKEAVRGTRCLDEACGDGVEHGQERIGLHALRCFPTSAWATHVKKKETGRLEHLGTHPKYATPLHHG
mgnify:CR=1 FL=1